MRIDDSKSTGGDNRKHGGAAAGVAAVVVARGQSGLNEAIDTTPGTNIMSAFCIFSVALIVQMPDATAPKIERVADAELEFTLVVPRGFRPMPESMLHERQQAKPKTTHGFVLGDPTDTDIAADTWILIERMGGVLRQESFENQSLPSGVRGRWLTGEWQGLTVNILEVRHRGNGIETLNLAAQIPLKRGAITLRIVGNVEKKKELHTHLGFMLQRLQGESNWNRNVPNAASQPGPQSSPAAQPSFDDPPLEPVGYQLFIAPAIIILVGCAVLWWISRNGTKGCVLATAIIIWWISTAFEDVQNGQAILIGGSLRILGILGGILGVSDLFRKNADTKQVSNADKSQNESKK